MADEFTEHLRRLGLPDAQARLYQHLLDTESSTPTQLANRVGQSAETLRSALDGLVKAGLAARPSTADGDVVPLEPTAGLELLAREREAELCAAQVATINAYTRFRKEISPPPTDDVVEMVSGTAVMDRIRQVECGATERIDRFDSPPYFRSTHTNKDELDNLATGVRYQVVYSRSSVANREYYQQNIRPCIAAGERARVLPGVPVKLTIVDRRVALISLPCTDVDVNTAILVVHPSSLLTALVGLFEVSWRTAFPMHVTAAAPCPLRPIHQRLLGLLATGVTDETAAELLGISRRTLTRHMEHLMARAGTTSRFQLALHARRSGWI